MTDNLQINYTPFYSKSLVMPEEKSSEAIGGFFFLFDRVFAANDSDEKHNDSDDQENVDEVTDGVNTDDTEKPQDDKNCCDCDHHIDFFD